MSDTDPYEISEDRHENLERNMVDRLPPGWTQRDIDRFAKAVMQAQLKLLYAEVGRSVVSKILWAIGYMVILGLVVAAGLKIKALGKGG